MMFERSEHHDSRLFFLAEILSVHLDLDRQRQFKVTGEVIVADIHSSTCSGSLDDSENGHIIAQQMHGCT